MDLKSQNELPLRKRLRREGADYSDCGSYFITLCVQGRRPLLWNMTQTFDAGIIPRPLLEPDSFQPVLSPLGELVQKSVMRIPDIYEMVSVEAFSIMPDHLHLILCIRPDEDGMKTSSCSIPHIIMQFKRSVTVQVVEGIWQRSYYDRILRNEVEYSKACEYIRSNPGKWRDEYLEKQKTNDCR